MCKAIDSSGFYVATEPIFQQKLKNKIPIYERILTTFINWNETKTLDATINKVDNLAKDVKIRAIKSISILEWHLMKEELLIC